MAYLMYYHGYDGSLIRMEQGVPSEPCCVEAKGERHEEMLMIFIGGSAYKKKQGILRD
jgi:hypothetical protein